ncbi:MAG: hypothetical protein POH28_04235 [Acidocella sp.]|nr:hypothetical protein [Acidocella sp.]
MSGLITSGNIAIVIMVLTILEMLVLLALKASFGWRVVDFLPNILAGDFLLLAWWLSGLQWQLSALALLGALMAHVVDMCRRGYLWSRSTRPVKITAPGHLPQRDTSIS